MTIFGEPTEQELRDYPAIKSVRGLVWFLVVVAAVLVLSACADGKELLAPEDPRYATMCADSTVVLDDYVCRREATISITIANPLYKPAP